MQSKGNTMSLIIIMARMTLVFVHLYAIIEVTYVSLTCSQEQLGNAIQLPPKKQGNAS